MKKFSDEAMGTLGENQLREFIQANKDIYFEIARYALSDGDIFDTMADKLDISDAGMNNLSDKLNEYMKRAGGA
jgi:hypothetical protein